MRCTRWGKVLHYLSPFDAHCTFQLEDGIINDSRLCKCVCSDYEICDMLTSPSFCSFDADVLLCANRHANPCLTGDQVSSVKKVYSDYYEGDEYVFGRVFPAGGEAALPQGLVSGEPFQLALDYYRYFVLK